MNENYKHSELTELIIKAFYKVYNTLGYGFQEKVYANALAFELRKLGHEAIREAEIEVYYEGEVIGDILPTCWLTKRSLWKPRQNVSSLKITKRNC